MPSWGSGSGTPSFGSWGGGSPSAFGGGGGPPSGVATNLDYRPTIVTNAIFMALAWICFTLRIFSRRIMKAALGWDDAFMFLALVRLKSFSSPRFHG